MMLRRSSLLIPSRKSHMKRNKRYLTLSSLQVSDILGKFPDLMEGFNEFLARCESLGKLDSP